METIDILNHYRIPLVSSADSIQLLARLLRDGPQTASDLSKSLEYESKKINRLLNGLYRAGFVEQRKVDLWVTSNLAEKVLDSLHLLDVAAGDLAQGFADTPSDKFFIKLWMDKPSHVKDSRTCLSLLRSLDQVQKLQKFNVHNLPDSSASLLYAIFITADRWAHEAGVENAAEVIQKELQTHLLTSGKENEKNINAESVAAEWRAAMRIYLDSNLMLLYMPKEPPRSTDNATVHLTWMRALDAALGGSADQGFKASCHDWGRDHASGFWRFILKHEAFEKPTRQLFEKWTGLPKLTSERLQSELTDRLLNVIATSYETRTYSKESNTVISDSFDDLVNTLEQASEKVNRVGIRIVPKKTRKPLRSALSTLEMALSVRSGPTPEEHLLENEVEQEWESRKSATRARVRRIITSYSPEYVKIASLWSTGKTITEIASETNMPLKKVVSRLAKMQKAVIQEIGIEETPENSVLIHEGLRHLVADSLPALF